MKTELLRVLLIDTDRDDYLAFLDLLNEIRTLKTALTWASSYAQGLAHMSDEDFDICFLNYHLNEKSGLDFLREVEDRGFELPIILLNGYGELQVDLEAMKHGAADCLPRDQVTPFLLDRSIRYSLYRAKIQRELREREGQLLIQERLASVGLLASSLAHEIGTPLGVIRGRAEYVLLKHQDDAHIKKDVGIMISQVDRVSKLIRSLLSLARGEVSEHSQVLDVSKVVGEVIELMAQAFQQQGIEIRNELKTNMKIRVLADSDPLHQIFLNLFYNSIHAIEAARTQGKVETHYIRIFAEEISSMWVIAVEDSGSGISKENLRNLFKPFFTTKGIGGGVGLGLALSYRIVESWKGTMQVESELGVGTVVKISIPKAVSKFSQSEKPPSVGNDLRSI